MNGARAAFGSSMPGRTIRPVSSKVLPLVAAMLRWLPLNRNMVMFAPSPVDVEPAQAPDVVGAVNVAVTNCGEPAALIVIVDTEALVPSSICTAIEPATDDLT